MDWSGWQWGAASATTRSRHLLDWQPHYDLARLIDAAYDFRCAPDDPRVVWYPD